MSNLYVAGIDAIDLGADETSSETRNPSEYCLVIKKRISSEGPPQYVCIYKDRPKDIREAYWVTLRLLQYYNCKALIEKSKVSLLTFFREKKKENQYLMRRPRATLSDIQRGKSKEFGVPATETIIRHQLDLIGSFVSDYSPGI